MNDFALLLAPPHEWEQEPALLDAATGTCLTYRALASTLRKVAGSLPPGAVLAACARPGLHHALQLLAAMVVGRTVCPVSFRLPALESDRLAAAAGAGAIWADGAWRSTGRSAATPVARGRTVIFTSGSAGAPKGVIHRLASHFASAAGAGTLLPLGPGCRWALDLPLHHVSGLAILFRCLSAGACVVFPDPAKPVTVQIEGLAITHLSVVSTQLRRLLREAAPLARLHAVLAGGGPFPAGLLDSALQAETPVYLTYGMTETASQIATGRIEVALPPEDYAVGRPLPGRELQIMNDGEIAVRGPVLFEGYLGSSPATNEQGWFRTGDLGRWTGDGRLQILGRLDRMFVSGGENIVPERIEAALLACPGVDAAHVAARPDPEFEARPVAFIAGAARSGDLRDRLQPKLASHEIPVAFFRWPKNFSAAPAKPPANFFKGLLAGTPADTYELKILE